MASWLPFPLPSSIQKRFLSYALSKIGIFDDASLDLDHLDLTWGKQNVVELKDVALDAEAISKKADLPANLRVKAGRISSLRLMVPADIHKSGIVIDAVGVRVSLRYQEENNDASEDERASTHAQSPAHRKTTRRIVSPVRRRGRGQRAFEADTLPTAQDLARSFLLEEPLEDRQRLEASVAAHSAALDDSVISESSQGTEPGTGAAIGVPTFLASFLAGVLDRVVVNVQDIRVVVDTHLPGSSSPSPNLAFQLAIQSAKIWSAASLTAPPSSSQPLRHARLVGITLDLLTEADQNSASPSLAASRTTQAESISDSIGEYPLQRSALASPVVTGFGQLQASVHTVDEDRFADAHDETPNTQLIDSEYDIRPGDDNISWGSRRDRQGPGTQDLWDSVADEDDLPDSLLFDERRVMRGDRRPEHSTPRLLPLSSETVSRPSAPLLPSPDPGSSPKHHSSESSASDRSAQTMESAEGDSPTVFEDAEDSSLQHSREFQPAVAAHDLAQSRIFSHAEAESMYMSAMTQDVQDSMAQVVMPGAWTTESPEHHELVAEPERTIRDSDAVETPRAQSPVDERHSQRLEQDIDERSRTNLISIGGVTLSVQLSDSPRRPSNDQGEARQAGNDFPKPGSRHAVRTMPREGSSLSTISDGADSTGLSSSDIVDNAAIAVVLQSTAVHCHIDPVTLQMLTKAAVALQRTSSKHMPKTTNGPQQTGPNYNVELSVQDVVLEVVEDLGASTMSTTLASLRCSKCHIRHKPDQTRLQFDALGLSLGETQVLHFEPEINHPGKALAKADLEVSYSSARTDLRDCIVPELTVHSQVLMFNFDLPAFANLVEHAGGLSSIVEIGSILSDHNPPASPTINKRSPGGVRFSDDTAVPADVPVQTKVNARLAGVSVKLSGQSCSVLLRSSSLKAVQREQGLSLSTAKIEISQLFSNTSSSKNAVVAESIRLDFLNAPTDKDLEKFLALLTPSNDKYDDNGDILIETLIRQRKKGACLRVQVDVLKAAVEDYQSLSLLASLTADLSQLSAVTKYLPEDDRPGVLSMIRVKDITAQLPTNPAFGDLRISLQELQCAHVGLPALLAMALSNLSITTATNLELVHQLLPFQGADNLPMVMVRTLGDEIEPNVKIKLFNVCAEYSVPTLLGLLGQEVISETITASIINSVADLSQSTHTLAANLPSTIGPKQKRTRVDLAIHNSAIGLTPLRLKSKVLVVLTDSKVSVTIPPSHTTQISLELRRAAIFVTDDAGQYDGTHVVSRRATTNTTTEARVADALSKGGYASAASLMSARVDICMTDATLNSERTIEVDIRNDLMLMETCADSTQTLIATLGALSPPSPPSTQPKYQLEPLTLEDMLSSFTGEAVTTTAKSPQTLFDVEDEPDMDESVAMQASQLADLLDDDLLLESEMTSSLYGPVSGLLSMPSDEQDDNDRPQTEAAESLLEEDPFVMTVTPDDLPFSDSTLAKDLRRQARNIAGQGGVTELQSMEIEDLGFVALGPEAHVLGAPHRFSAPVAGRSIRPGDTSHCPIKVRLRDVHFIWNLHDGYDWQRTRDGISSAVEQVEQRAEERLARRRQSRGTTDDEESVIEDFLFNSIYIGVPSTQEAQDIRRQINRHIDDLASETESVPLSGMSRPTAYSASGRPTNRPRRRLKLERGRSHKIAFELKGLSVDFVLFPPDASELQSSVDVRVQSLEIFDNVPTSTWRKFLTLLKTEGGREMSKPMVHLELDNVKTIQNYAATEMVLSVTLLPLRLHVDQDALDFITRFFEFKDDSKLGGDEPAEQPFLQRVEVNTVDLQLDYKPKKIDYVALRSGHTTEFMNLIVLDAANIRLKHAIVYGIKGFEPLHKTLNDVWMPDVRRNQLPTVLAGLAPVRSLVNIGTGVRDVVAIPVREYQQDGRVVRSISKGAFHFGKTTASELARLGAKVAIGTQNILSGAEGLLAPNSASSAGRASPSHRVSSDHGWHEVEEEDSDREKRAISAYADQPLGVLAGLRSAQRYLEHDLLTARDALIAVQGEVLNSSTPGAAAAAVARHAPTVILRPVIGASRAVGTALLGVGNQIDRDNLRRMEDKYKRH